ncbi:MAG: hypothetical protein JST62_01455 [Bacteroidetes bacterium]|jgi:lipopolysaccharide export LptBFGC system permease protein LptF|nr:hypothetical protein [Bacteroidota bacterium]
MKKIIFTILFTFSVVGYKAQYGTINAILDKLEARKGINQQLGEINFDDLKFVLIKDFDDHTERNFIVIKDKNATYIEISDDKKNGQSTTKVYSGDMIKTKKNVVSFRFDKLEGKKIAIPLSKVLLLTRQDEILYLLDANNKDRWIEESSIKKNK